jgi:hypothetical protein
MNKIVDEISEIITAQRKTLKSQNKPIPADIPAPNRLLNSFGEPTAKALKYNRKLIREGLTFSYLDLTKFYNPKTNGFFTPKRDKRYKKEIKYVKKFRDLEKMGQVIIENSLEVENEPNYLIDVINKLNDLKAKGNELYELLNQNLLTATATEAEAVLQNIENLESQEFIIDLTKISWAEVLEQLLQNVSSNFFFIGKPTNSTSWITFSSNNLEKLKNINTLYGDDYKERIGSDNQFVFDITKSSSFVLKIMVRRKKETDNGAFFKYYHKIKDLDINGLGIYSTKPKNYNKNCLYIALEETGLEKDKLNAMKEFVKCGSVPITKLKNIAEKLSIHIELKRIKQNGELNHYGDKENKTYRINLIDNHYFCDKEIDITSFAVKNYDEVKHIKDFHKINKKRYARGTRMGKITYEKSNKHKINSFTLVKLLLENKDMVLDSIPIEDIMATPYYNNMIDNNDLDYDITENTNINDTISTDNRDNYRIFFDFETDTSRKDKNNNPLPHKPYLMCGLTQDNLKIAKYGEDCGKQFLDSIRNKFKDEKPLEKHLCDGSRNKGCVKEVSLIAHNCRYDFTFLIDYLSACGLKPVLNGTRLMGGSAVIYLNDHKDRHKCSNKCGKKCKKYNKVEVKYKFKDGVKREHVSPFIKINFQDSYNLISKPLRDFKDMFKLECKKEILPYSLYTTKNISKKLVDKNECLSHIENMCESNLNDNIKCKGCGHNRTFGKCDDMGKWYCDSCWKEEYLKNAKEWKCIVGDFVDIIKYSKKYCEMDCKVLKKGYDTFRSWIKEVCDLDIVNYCSIASLSMDYLIKEGCFSSPIEEEITLNEMYKLQKYYCWKLSGRPRDFIQKCVVGGRTMCRDNKKWLVEGRINDFDAVSLYPSAMYRMKGFLKGVPKVIKKENLNIDWLQNNTDGYFVKVMAINDAENHGFPLLSNNEEDGIRNFSNQTKGNIYYLDKTSLEDAMNFQKIKFNVICGYYYDDGHNNKINSVMKHLFNTRLEAKKNGNPIQEIYKLLMNSSYGKTLLKPIETDLAVITKKSFPNYLSRKYNFIREITESGDKMLIKETKVIDDHYNNCYAGVEVLSMSKRLMNEVMCLAQEKDLKIYYQDTDSMHINDKDIEILEKEFRSKYNRELIGKNMGQFHSDFDLGKAKNIVATKSIFLGKKSYYDKLEGDLDGKLINGTHTRMKGINTEGMTHYCKIKNCSMEELYERLYEHDTLWENKNYNPKDKKSCKYDKFDLMAGGTKCKFMYNKDLSVQNCSSFSRGVNFKYEKGIIV